MKALYDMSNNSKCTTRTVSWFANLVQQTRLPRQTFYDWWHAFCRETGLSITPSQALESHREQFFHWLGKAQRQVEDKKAHNAEVAAAHERTRRCTAALEELGAMAEAYGAFYVQEHVVSPWKRRWVYTKGAQQTSPQDEPPR